MLLLPSLGLLGCSPRAMDAGAIEEANTDDATPGAGPTQGADTTDSSMTEPVQSRIPRQKTVVLFGRWRRPTASMTTHSHPF